MVENSKIVIINSEATFLGEDKKLVLDIIPYGKPIKAYWFKDVCIIQFDDELGSRFDNISAFSMTGEKIYTIESRSDKLGKKSWCNFGTKKPSGIMCVGDFFGFIYEITNPHTGELSEPVYHK